MSKSGAKDLDGKLFLPLRFISYFIFLRSCARQKRFCRFAKPNRHQRGLQGIIFTVVHSSVTLGWVGAQITAFRATI